MELRALGFWVHGLILGLGAGATYAEAMGCLDTLPMPPAVSQAVGQAVKQGEAGERALNQTLDSALKAMHGLHYAQADSLLRSAPLKTWPLAQYFSGILLLQRSEDLGDTAAFHQAHAHWGKLWSDLEKAQGLSQTLLRALVGLQWAATDQHYGKNWHALRISMQAKSLLTQSSQCPEAKAALALLDYYRSQLLPAWTPGGRKPRDAAQDLHLAAKSCRRMQPLFMTAWLWTQFDLAQWDSGLKTLTGYLQGYPNHRLYRQMRGDFLFRSGRPAEALQAYREAIALYPAPSPAGSAPPDLQRALTPPPPLWVTPVGYLGCAGNLARIHAALGQSDSARHYLDIWESPRFKPLDPWLPTSLKKALKPLRSKLR